MKEKVTIHFMAFEDIPRQFSYMRDIGIGKWNRETIIPSRTKILEKIFAEWNSGSGQECDEFKNSRFRSLSVGDIVEFGDQGNTNGFANLLGGKKSMIEQVDKQIECRLQRICHSEWQKHKNRYPKTWNKKRLTYSQDVLDLLELRQKLLSEELTPEEVAATITSGNIKYKYDALLD